jgi:predicted DNA-binding protein YlxM (UPF0122 family)
MTSPEKVLRISQLLDIYGKLLTPRQTELTRMYYEQDETLGEISEDQGISRQAVHDAIKKAEAALEKYEEVLGLLQKKGDAEPVYSAARKAGAGSDGEGDKPGAAFADDPDTITEMEPGAAFADNPETITGMEAVILDDLTEMSVKIGDYANQLDEIINGIQRQGGIYDIQALVRELREVRDGLKGISETET